MLVCVNKRVIDIKDVTCGFNGEKGIPYSEPIINMYVSVTKKCNANCPFCEFNDNTYDTEFDMDKFKYSVDKILESVEIFKLSFTGGEPSLRLDILEECLKYVKDKDSRIFTVINTNGVNLKKLESLDLLDNIALSRHALSDLDNKEIFKTDTVATSKDISNFKYKNKLHLSCNLIKGYIDRFTKILEYLEMASCLGVKDVGFVSLMPINEFCLDKGIDFSDIRIKESSKFIINREFCREVQDKTVCKCRNYLYSAENLDIITAYSRFVVAPDSCNNSLVYIGNQLRLGFTGDVIVE